jgi:tartrate dehydratase alpha subunit/fumarate hydratase class I-like protein
MAWLVACGLVIIGIGIGGPAGARASLAALGVARRCEQRNKTTMVTDRRIG